MLERFNKEFVVVKMNRNSLTLVNNKFERAFIHRNAYNKLLNNLAEDYRVVEREFNGTKSLWVEILTWNCL